MWCFRLAKHPGCQPRPYSVSLQSSSLYSNLIQSNEIHDRSPLVEFEASRFKDEDFMADVATGSLDDQYVENRLSMRNAWEW